MSNVPNLELGYKLQLSAMDDGQIDLGRTPVPISDLRLVTKPHFAISIHVSKHCRQGVAERWPEFFHLERPGGCAVRVGDEAGL
jgi:hypothetical protein